MDVSKVLDGTELPVSEYGTIAKIPPTGLTPPPLPHARESFTHIDYYMDGVISAVQGRPERQHRVFDGTIRALKWIFSSLPVDIKDLVILKNPGRGEQIDLRKRVPEVEGRHGGGNIRPPKEKAFVNPHPIGYSSNKIPRWPRRAQVFVGKAPIQAPHGIDGN